MTDLDIIIISYLSIGVCLGALSAYATCEGNEENLFLLVLFIILISTVFWPIVLLALFIKYKKQ